MSGEALAWATPLWERRDPVMSNLKEFLATFRKVFEEPGHASSVAFLLLWLQQGNSTIGQYAIQFRILASGLAWHNETLVATFREGLSGHIKDELAGRDLPISWDDLISLVTRINIWFAERQRKTEKLCESERPQRTPRFAPTFLTPLLLLGKSLCK